MSDFKHYQCWQQERAGEVINKEAIAINIADFMATHAPLGPIRDLQASGEKVTPVSHWIRQPHLDLEGEFPE